MIVEFDEWRQDLEFADGQVIKDVLFVRVKCGDYEYHTPIIVGEGYDEAEAVKDAKVMLFMKATIPML